MNAFEMLWNVDKNKNTAIKAIEGKDSATEADPTAQTCFESSKKMLGHALSIKEQYIRAVQGSQPASSSFRSLVDICQNVRKAAADSLNK